MLTYSVSQLYILGHVCDRATEDGQSSKLLAALDKGKKSAADLAKESSEDLEDTDMEEFE